MYVCMYVAMYVWMYVSMYVCMYACMMYAVFVTGTSTLEVVLLVQYTPSSSHPYKHLFILRPIYLIIVQVVTLAFLNLDYKPQSINQSTYIFNILEMLSTEVIKFYCHDLLIICTFRVRFLLVIHAYVFTYEVLTLNNSVHQFG